MNSRKVTRQKWVTALLVVAALIAGLGVTQAAIKTIQLNSAASFPVDM